MPNAWTQILSGPVPSRHPPFSAYPKAMVHVYPRNEERHLHRLAGESRELGGGNDGVAPFSSTHESFQ